VNKDLKLHQRKWQCTVCGTKHDRDINAAKNIKVAGLKKLSGRGTPSEPVELPALAGTVKQECNYFKNDIIPQVTIFD